MPYLYFASVNCLLACFWGRGGIHFYNGLFVLPPIFRDFSFSIPEIDLLSITYVEVSSPNTPL